MSPGRRRAVVALLSALLAGACTEPAPETREARISGTARLPDGTVPGGTLHVHVYRAFTGEGELRHPLGPVGDFTSQSGAFSGSVSYVPDDGEGLVVYAWLDTDGDGVLCTPSSRADPAGLTVANGFPADAVSVDLVLSENCRAANWFFPPVAGR